MQITLALGAQNHVHDWFSDYRWRDALRDHHENRKVWIGCRSQSPIQLHGVSFHFSLTSTSFGENFKSCFQRLSSFGFKLSNFQKQ